MKPAQFDGGSFRDPSGRVVRRGDRIFRAIFEPGLGQFQAVQQSGILDALVERGWLLPAYPVGLADLDPDLRAAAPSARQWLEHPRLPYISYPYEWCFSALKSAALLHLDLHLTLLEQGFTLSDATAYNIQFRGTRPVFIDHLSVIPYSEGSAWVGQRQFGMQFLNPLYLWSKKRVSPLAWYRGSLEGIAPEDLARILGWRDCISLTVLAHIQGPAFFARRHIAKGLRPQPQRVARLPKSLYVALLYQLRDYISDLSLPVEKTEWDDYAQNNSYDDLGREFKHRFVAETVAAGSPRMLFDIGCNSGDYCQTALSHGAQSVIGFDFDFGALERAFVRFDRARASVLPLWLDVTNPSPSQGWAEKERLGLRARSDADMILALALIHHLSIGRNVPLDMAVDWLMGLAPAGIIEFPSKADPMVMHLLRQKSCAFPEYTEEAFLTHVAARGRITRKEHIGANGRLVIGYNSRV